jgi:hypothetical protein
MSNFDQLENKKDFKKAVLIISGIIILAVIVAIVLVLRKGSKETFNSSTLNSNTPTSPVASNGGSIFSENIASWTSYYWPGKINTHYPSNWQLEEEKNNSGSIMGLKIVPPTGNSDDTIFIGGASVKCSTVLKYPKSACLRDKIQVPFYTNSQNQDVLAAFDLIFQNTILTEEQK